MQELQKIIDEAFENRASLSPTSAPAIVRDAVATVIDGLDTGRLRVAEKIDGSWTVNQWIKKAVLISFRLRDNEIVSAGSLNYFDKVPTKFGDYTPEQFREGGFRVVPPAVARKGSFIGKNVVLMPSYVNIGAYVDENSMVDTWATVGSCAQIGKNVHLSGGVGIGGVLEPPGARPVIVEDGCFVGSRAIVVEGVRIGAGAVIAPNVVLSASVPIIDVTGPKPEEYRGEVPARAVVLPGVREKDFPAGRYGLPCALIVGERSASTDLKTSLNEVLREFEIAV